LIIFSTHVPYSNLFYFIGPYSNLSCSDILQSFLPTYPILISLTVSIEPYSTLSHTAKDCNKELSPVQKWNGSCHARSGRLILQRTTTHTATHCNLTVQHTATHTTTHYNSPCDSRLNSRANHYNARCSVLQHSLQHRSESCPISKESR